MSQTIRAGVTKLLSGDVLSALIGLITFAMIASYLGAEKFGTLVLLETYVLVLTNFLKPQTWQLLVTYGNTGAKDKNDFSSLITLGIIFDLVFILCSFLVGYLCMEYYFSYMAISENMKLVGMIILLQLLFNFDGVAIGLLRLTEQHGSSALRSIIIALIKLAMVFIVIFGIESGIEGIAIAILIAKVIGIIYLNIYAFNSLLKDYSYKVSFYTIEKIKELTVFVFYTGATAGLKTSFREIDILIVGRFLNLTDVAALQIVKKIISVPMRLSNPLGNVIYVKFSNYLKSAQINEYSKLKKQSLLAIFMYVLVVVLGVLIVPEFIIIYVFGVEVTGLKSLLFLYSFTLMFTLLCIPPSYSMLAKGYSKINFQIHLLTSLIYFPVIYFCVQGYGLSGVPIALIIFGFIRFITLYFMDKKHVET